MKTQLLPHYFKKIGLAIFIAMSLPAFCAGVSDGWTAGKYTLLSEETIRILDIIGIVGIVLYAFSKDKVYDELLHRLKLESLKLTFLISLAVILCIYIFFPNLNIHASYLINLQIIGFIGIYYYKKSNIISATGPEYNA